jgi:hypothetical protein
MNNNEVTLIHYLCFNCFSVKSFIELFKFLFSLPEVQSHNLAFLSNHLCQDPLEKYFGCQRQRGGTNENPTVESFLKNTEALRVVNSFCRSSVRGNCRGSESNNANIQVNQIDFAPLAKRRRTTKNL